MSDSTDRPKTGETHDPSVMTPESLRESLDELANNVDILVDRLTMDMTDSPVEEEKQPPPKAPPEPPPAAVLETEVPATAEIAAAPDGGGSLESDNELFDLAEEVIESLTSRTKTPLKPVAVPTMKQQDDLPAVERSGLPWDDEPADSVTELTTEPEITAQAPAEAEELSVPELDAMADLMVDSLTSDPPVAGAEAPAAELEEGLEIDLSAEIESVPPAVEKSSAAEIAKPVEAPAAANTGATPWARSEVPIKRRRGSGRWMKVAAAGIMIGVAGSVAWMMLGRKTSTTEVTNRVVAAPKTIETLVPDAAAIPVVTPETVQPQSPDQPPAVVDTSPAPQKAAPSPATKPAAKPRSIPKPPPVVPKPRAEPVVAATQSKPTPSRVFPPPPPKAAVVEPKPEPKPVEPVAAKPDPKPVAVAALTPPEPPVAKPIETQPVQTTPRPEPPSAPANQQPPAPRPTPGTPPTEAGTTGPAVAGEIQPPELVSRQEAIYPEKSRKRGESGVVVLKVLVSEKGRVARVVIEQGIRGSDLEARAIDAALRSVYRPATQDGLEIRAWITERFVFEP